MALCKVLSSFSLAAVPLATPIVVDLPCDNAKDCANMINKVQIQGTQQANLESLELLNRSLTVHPTNEKLWELMAKLNVFYMLQWDVASEQIDHALALNESKDAHLFRGWLRSTPGRRNVSAAEDDYQTALQLAEPRDFWPHFEYASWLSHIADRFNESQKEFEIVQTHVPQNPFLLFFYGMLLKYHLGEDKTGSDMIAQAHAVAGELSGQSAGNLAFQAQLLTSRRRFLEAEECCTFSRMILDPSKSSWELICPLVPAPLPSSCTANPGCNALGLVGDCCPATDGTMLACCSGALVTNSSVLLV